jgi:hypothetical protein
MTNEEILREIGSLPPEGQRRVENLLAYLRKKYSDSVSSSFATPLQSENFIGMWKDRDDMADSSTWVRGLRESEWGQ